MAVNPTMTYGFGTTAPHAVGTSNPGRNSRNTVVPFQGQGQGKRHPFQQFQPIAAAQEPLPFEKEDIWFTPQRPQYKPGEAPMSDLSLKEEKKGNLFYRIFNGLALGMIGLYQFVTRKVPIIKDVYPRIVKCLHAKEGHLSCSEYGVAMYKEFNVLRASVQTTKRLLTCSPLWLMKDLPGFRWVGRWAEETSDLAHTKAALGINQLA